VSKERSRDKLWITPALKKSCHIKNSLYRTWIKTSNRDDEIKYKEYRKKHLEKL